MSDYADQFVDDLIGRLRWWRRPELYAGFAVAGVFTWLGLDDRFMVWLGGVLFGFTGALVVLIYKLQRLAVKEFRA